MLNYIFLVLSVIGLFIVSITASQLGDSNQSFGPHTLSLMTPLVISSLYLLFCIYYSRLNKFRSLLAISLFFIVSIPLYPFITQEIYHLGDDGWRYSVYAKNIISKPTFWGSSGLIRQGKLIFMDQPGYRYWVAFTMFLFDGERRVTQFFNLFSFLFVSIIFLLALQKKLGKNDMIKISIFMSLSSPYVAKNILLNLSEWITLMFFMLYLVFLINDKPLLSIINLALVPFIRQNLIIFTILIGVISIFHFRRKILVLPFGLILSLPLIHNIYYANKFQFFAGQVSSYAISSEYYSGVLPSQILSFFYRLIEYTGYEGSTNLFGLILAWLFVPSTTMLLIYELLNLRSKRLFIILLLIATAVIPTLFYGFAYYPRFVYVNQAISLFLIYTLKNNSILSIPLISDKTNL